MSEYVPAALRRDVRQRANQCCEFCLIHEDDVLLSHSLQSEEKAELC